MFLCSYLCKQHKRVCMCFALWWQTDVQKASGFIVARRLYGKRNFGPKYLVRKSVALRQIPLYYLLPTLGWKRIKISLRRKSELSQQSIQQFAANYRITSLSAWWVLWNVRLCVVLIELWRRKNKVFYGTPSNVNFTELDNSVDCFVAFTKLVFYMIVLRLYRLCFCSAGCVMLYDVTRSKPCLREICRLKLILDSFVGFKLAIVKIQNYYFHYRL